MVILMSNVNANKQKGVVLIVTLVIVMIVTLLGLSSVKTTNAQLRMSRNVRDGRVAFQAAESGLKAAEAVLAIEDSLATYQANTDGSYVEGAVGVASRWEADATWQGVNSVVVDYDDSAEPPRYIIEFVKTVVAEEDRLNLDNVGGETGSGRTQMFRITALGTGKTASAKTMIQSTYGRKF